MKKMTHVAIYTNRIGYRTKVELRETKKYWITKDGTKYLKDYGYPAGEKFPMCGIDLNTIKEIEKDNDAH